MPDAVTIPVLIHYTNEDKVLAQVGQDVLKGRLRGELTNTKYRQVWAELSYVDKVLLRVDRIVIPTKLRANILALAHEGHPGIVSILQQLREDMWWQGMTKDTEEYVSTCSVGCGSSGQEYSSTNGYKRDTREAMATLCCRLQGANWGEILLSCND